MHKQARPSRAPGRTVYTRKDGERKVLGLAARRKPGVTLPMHATGATVEHAKQERANGRREKIEERRVLRRLGLPSFNEVLKERDVPLLKRSDVKIFQLNIGLYCNQACTHCHVESSPARTEMMDQRTAEQCVKLMKSSSSVKIVDLTGGAPELNAQFRYLVREARALGLDIIDRCNLTVLLEPGQEGLAEFLAENKVRVVASLPCYNPSTVDAQRGWGVFNKSIEALKMLNALGYGTPGSGLVLELVYNPSGAFLAPAQGPLEIAYRAELRDTYGVEFNSLLALNNMPVKRFADWLHGQGKLEDYMQLLLDSFNPAAVEGLMCRDTLSVSWDGTVYDCDFNQQLGLGMQKPEPATTGAQADLGSSSQSLQDSLGSRKGVLTVFDLDSLDNLAGRPIIVDQHCYGCTAGTGSSCQGQLA